MGLIDVEHHARAARAGVQSGLQILDVGVERRGVEGYAADARLHAAFVVPQRLVVIVLVAAEDRPVLGRAQRDVQRVVHAAEAEALRGLGVEGDGVRRLVAEQEAWGEAVRRGLVGAVVAIGEQAARLELAGFAEVVVAAAGRRGQLAHRVVHFAEQGLLLDVVGQIGVVGRVGREAVGHGGRGARAQNGVGEGVVARGRQALIVDAVDLRIEAADHPLEGAFAVRGQTQFLGKLLQVGGVDQLGRQGHRRAREAQVDRDAARQGAGVAVHGDVAVDQAGDRGQVRPVEAEVGDHVGDQGVVGEALVQQQILLAFAHPDLGTGGRVVVGEEVEDLLAVEAASPDLLIDDARRDADGLGRLEQQRDATAATGAVVDVLLDLAAFLARVDEAAVAGQVADGAQGDLVGHRQVHGALHVAAEVVAARQVRVGFERAFVDADLGLVGDVADRAADRARTEQRALRTAQGLDAVQVEQVDVRGEQRQRGHGFVEIDADLLLHARLVADHLAGGNAAHRDLALAGAEVLDRQTGDVARQVFKGHRARALDVLFRLGVDREGNVLDRRVALGRGDDDLFDGVLIGLLSGREGRNSKDACKRTGAQQRARAAARCSDGHGYLPYVFRVLGVVLPTQLKRSVWNRGKSTRNEGQ